MSKLGMLIEFYPFLVSLIRQICAEYCETLVIWWNTNVTFSSNKYPYNCEMHT